MAVEFVYLSETPCWNPAPGEPGISFNKYSPPTTGQIAVNKTDPSPLFIELIGRGRK